MEKARLADPEEGQSADKDGDEGYSPEDDEMPRPGYGRHVYSGAKNGAKRCCWRCWSCCTWSCCALGAGRTAYRSYKCYIAIKYLLVVVTLFSGTFAYVLHLLKSVAHNYI